MGHPSPKNLIAVKVLLLVLSNAFSMQSATLLQQEVVDQTSSHLICKGHSPQVYKTIKGPVLLTIAGAGGLSLALQATGIAMPLGPKEFPRP